MSAEPPRNAYHELSGKSVSVAHRNAQRMTSLSYEWAAFGTYGACRGYEDEHVPESGTVFTPSGDAYAIWLPGVLYDYPEGRCECAFFLTHAICKHLFFAAKENDKAISRAYDGYAPRC